MGAVTLSKVNPVSLFFLCRSNGKV